MENTNNNYRTLVVIVALVVVVVFAGYIYKSSTEKSADLPKSIMPKELEGNTNAFINQLNNRLTDEEKVLLNMTSGTLTKAEGQAHFDLATKLAVEGSELNITNCLATPAVLKVKNGSTITVFNGGTKDFPFGFDKDKVTVPLGKSISYKVNFKLGQGLYGYGCDNKEVSRGVGLILVTP
jgi:plastocyanin